MGISQINSLKSRRLTEEDNPFDLSHWEMLYARSLGCIGLLKLHLIRALALALTENAQTITQTHLRTTAPPEDRVKEMLSAALAGEEDLTEPDGADERLLELLGLREKATIAPMSAGNEQDQPTPGSVRRKPGDRKPGRDVIGEGGERSDPGAQREQAAG
jgi:hypothetical protein